MRCTLDAPSLCGSSMHLGNSASNRFHLFQLGSSNSAKTRKVTPKLERNPSSSFIYILRPQAWQAAFNEHVLQRWPCIGSIPPWRFQLRVVPTKDCSWLLWRGNASLDITGLWLILRIQVQQARVVLDCAALARFLAAGCLCQTIGVNFGGRAASQLQQPTGLKALQEFRLVHFLAAEHSLHTEGLREIKAKKGEACVLRAVKPCPQGRSPVGECHHLQWICHS